MGWAAKGSGVVVATGEAPVPALCWIESNEMPDALAMLLSVMITPGVSSFVGIACVRLKTFAERTAGSACVNADELLRAISACTAAVCCLRLAASDRFGATTAK